MTLGFTFITFEGRRFIGCDTQKSPKFLFIVTVGQWCIAVNREQLIGEFTAQIFFVENTLSYFGGMRSFDNIRIFSNPYKNLNKIIITFYIFNMVKKF